MELIGNIVGILWGPWTPFTLLALGVLFTLWTKFSQYTAMTHGIAVVRGVYDDPNDPGAINHFQALSAALSATVGLGNIGGVALAIGAGGPGALFWMWIVGFFGMALKTVEISLAMMYRNTDDPDNPHGGAMWVVDKVIGSKGDVWKPIARIIGIFFCITLIVSTFTGGNMFQAWSVATLTNTYFGVPRIVTGIILATVVGLVIIGGIKRIGNVAGKLVPLMCLIYLVSALAVLVMHIGEIPSLLALIVRSAFNPTEAGGAFVGGTIGYAFIQGMKRALFSNEAGQGSAPIAHAAAKTDEPAREGIVGGIGPFIDTICICTLTALVILTTGTWNRAPLIGLESAVVTNAINFDDTGVTLTGEANAGDTVFMNVTGVAAGALTTSSRLTGTLQNGDDGEMVVAWNHYAGPSAPAMSDLSIRVQGEDPPVVVGTLAAAPTGTVAEGEWSLVTPTKTLDVPADQEYRWENIDAVFTIVLGDESEDTGTDRTVLSGTATRSLTANTISVSWGTVTATERPTMAEQTGLFRQLDGAQLTGLAFDRQFPGLGKYLVTLAAWLFAISTMISWSYYGEQGVIYIVGNAGVFIYKLLFLVGVIYAAAYIVNTDDMVALMDLGTGAMLWSNLPIVLALGFLAVGNYSDYIRRLKAGEFIAHKAPPFEDVVDGTDVE